MFMETSAKRGQPIFSAMKKWLGQLVVPGYLLGMTSPKTLGFCGDDHRLLQELSIKHVFFSWRFPFRI